MPGQPRIFPESQYLTNAMDMAKHIATRKVDPGSTVIDATMGNGYDTVFLNSLVGPEGKVFAFDIQEESIQNTSRRLRDSGVSTNVQLILDTHASLSKWVEVPVRLIMFNLGYLPGKNKTLCTTADTTRDALLDGLELLDPTGIILVINYRGHPLGKQEQVMLDQFLPTLDQKTYSTACLQFLNQQNEPPALYIIEKI